MTLDWENAKKWEEYVNRDKEIYNEPKWSFDCGFKLDYDGSLLSINSRFYPPAYNNDKWEGKLKINILDKNIITKNFKSDNLDDLKDQIEKYVKFFTNILKSKFV